MIITNSKQLKERGTLRLHDQVLLGRTVYSVGEDHLCEPNFHNADIFHELEFDPEEVAAEAYGYAPLGGVWPCSVYGDYAALTRLVAELYAKLEAVTSAIPGGLTFAEMVAKVEGYPGKGVPYPRDDQEVQRMHRLIHAGLGLPCEVGEILDHIKSRLQYGTPIHLGDIVPELGDLKHFLQMLCNILDVDYEDLGPLNAHKIHTRYPDYDFSQHNAKEGNRDRDAEQKVFDKYNGRYWQ